MYAWTVIQLFLGEPCFRCLKYNLHLGPRLLQYKAERLGWSDSLLLQTEAAALICDYGREQIHYRHVLYMTLLQKTRTVPLRCPVGDSCAHCMLAGTRSGATPDQVPGSGATPDLDGWTALLQEGKSILIVWYTQHLYNCDNIINIRPLKRKQKRRKMQFNTNNMQPKWIE